MIFRAENTPVIVANFEINVKSDSRGHGPIQSYVAVFEPLKVFLQKDLKRLKRILHIQSHQLPTT